MNIQAERHAQVAVIGGGIIGCAAAYYIARSGLDCILLEKGDIASGTSSRCEGNISAVDKDPGFDSQMSMISQQLARELTKELDLSFEYNAKGSLLVCETETEMAAATQWVDRQNAAGLSFRMLDRADIRQESPYFADDLLGGLACATDALINPYLFCYALIDKAQQHGLRVYPRAGVTAIARLSAARSPSARVPDFRIETTAGTFTARQVVNAAGVWAPFIGQMLGISIPITPRKGHIIVGARQQPVIERNVMEFGYLINKFGGTRQVDPDTEKHGVALVLEPVESRNFLIGSSRQFVGYDSRIDLQVVQTMARRALRFFPKLADFNLIRTYTGMRPWTADHLPIVSAVDEVPGFYIAAGHEGDGISLATVTGKLIAQMLHGQADTIIPTAPLRYDRFAGQAGKGAESDGQADRVQV